MSLRPLRGIAPRLLLSLACIASLPSQAADEAPVYKINECATPLRLVIDGLPSIPPARLAGVVETCGNPSGSALFESKGYSENIEQWNTVRDRLPEITIIPNHGKFDVRVTLRDEKLPRAYQAVQVPLGAASLALARVGHEGGPDLRISLERLDGGPYVGLQIVNSPAAQVAQDLVRIKRLKVRHIERINSKITLRFDIIPVQSVLRLLASVSGLDLGRNGNGEFVIGTIRNEQEIAVLLKQADEYRERREIEKLKEALEKIVALGNPNDADYVEAYAFEQLAELADLAIEEKDYARAEALDRERMAQLERGYGTTDLTDYALALADLGRARWDQKDSAGGKALLERALAMIEKHEGPDSPPSARVISNLAGLAFEAGKLDEATSLNLHAIKILQATAETDWRALYVASGVESRLALEFGDRKDDASAQAHWERAVALREKLWGENDPLIDLDREGLTNNLNKQGKTEAVAALYARQIALCEKRKSQLSYYCASALRNLTQIRAGQGKFAEAIALWQRVIALRSEVLGAHSSRMVAALKDLELLYRLDGQLPQAVATVKRAQTIQIDNDDKGTSAKVESRLRDELTRLDLALVLAVTFQDELEAQQAKLAPNDVALALTEERKAEAYAVIGTDSMAIHGYERAWSIRLKAQGVDHADTQRTAQRLVELYERNGNAPGAERVRQRMKSK